MRIMKCGIALILILTMCLSAGCDVAPAQTTSPAETTVAPTEPTFPRPVEVPLNLTEPEPYKEGEKTVSCQLLPETLDNPENLPVLKWVSFCTSSLNEKQIYVSYDKSTQWSEEAADAVNAMLAAENMPFRIQFVLFTTEERGNIDWLRVPEVRQVMKEADLITGVFTQAEAMCYLMPITEYISEDAELSLAGLVPHEINWKLTTRDGEVFGIPLGRVYPVAGGWHVRDEVFAEYGFSAEDFQKDFFAMDEVFAELYEKNGGKGFLNYFGSSLTSSSYNGVTVMCPSSIDPQIDSRFQCIGGCYAVDYSGESPVVVNYLETEYVRQLQKKFFEYTMKGYCYVKGDANHPVSYWYCYSAYSNVYEEAHGSCLPGNIWMIPTEKTVCEITLGDLYTTGVLTDTNHRELVLQLLEKMGEDECFLRQLLYGEEGKDYAVVDGLYIPLSREDGSYCMSFVTSMRYFCGLETERSQIELPEGDGMTKLETYQASIEQSQFWAPVEFNWSQMTTEKKEIWAILERYLPAIPMVSDDYYDNMLTEIREAGGDRVKRELQRQLDEWFEENPEWLELCSLNKTEN